VLKHLAILSWFVRFRTDGGGVLLVRCQSLLLSSLLGVVFQRPFDLVVSSAPSKV
jgi:hypothetical protein